MESKTRENEAMNPMNIAMNPGPPNTMRGCQYFFPDYQAMQNYAPMAMYNNLPQMNGYPYQIEFNKEEPPMGTPTAQDNLNIQKNQNSNQALQDKQKNKPYINLLLNTVTTLMKEGKVTMKYLKEKTDYKAGHTNCNNSRNSPETASSQTIISYKKPNNEKQNNINNNAHDIGQCENPLCKSIFNSNKDKFNIKIKGLKTQSKNLCKKCYDSVGNGHFCYYCNAIYRDDMTDSAKWVQCDFCQKWEHFDCELQKGKRYFTVQELNEVKNYKCPMCTNDKNEPKHIDNKIQKKLINKKRRGDVFDDQKCKKNQRKDLRNLKSEKYSELLEDMELINSFVDCK